MTERRTIKYYATFTKGIDGECIIKGLHINLDEALKILEATYCVVTEIVVPVGASFDEVVRVAIREGEAFFAKLERAAGKNKRKQLKRELCDIPQYRMN